MSALSYIAALFGIIAGVILTLQINRMMNNRPFEAYQSESTINYGNGTVLSTNGKSSSPETIEQLRHQRDSLRSQLEFIEKKLAAVTAPSKHVVLTTSRPVGSPAIVPALASVPVSTTIGCPYNFKVYVYEIPQAIDAVRISLEARRNKTLHVCHKCILEQFALEYIINDYFQHFCGRTTDPEQADYFYLPLVRDAEFRYVMAQSTRNRAPSAAEWALLNLLEKNDSALWKSVFNITDRYWHRHHGADHIIVMPAPVTNLRHETSQRGFFHYMMHLHPPIFLCLEYSLGFVREYPVCATQKNIVVPYPTIDPELYNGKLINAPVERKYLLYYAGGLHGDCVEVRHAMKMIMRNASSLPNVIPPVRSSIGDREHGFLAATFCPIPIGDSPSSKRMYDVLNFGCIPVVLSDDLVWAYTFETGGTLNHSLFSIQIPQSVVHYTARKTLARYEKNRAAMGVLPATKTLIYDLLQSAVTKHGEYQNGVYMNPLVLILQNIPAEDVKLLQSGVVHAAPLFRYYNMHPDMRQIPLVTHAFPDGGAMQVIAHRLSMLKQRGIGKVHAQCAAERARNHNYIRNFHCDGRDKVESLVRRRRLMWS